MATSTRVARGSGRSGAASAAATPAARVARPGAAPALPLGTPRTRHASPVVAQRGTNGQRDRSVET
eukprot:scaffold109328_cov69-Phaeocystis_antarctica.AAC.2